MPVLVPHLSVASGLAEDREGVEVGFGDAGDGQVDGAEARQALPERERVALHRERHPRAEVLGDLLGVAQVGGRVGRRGRAGALGSQAGERARRLPSE